MFVNQDKVYTVMPSTVLKVQLLAIHFVTWHIGTFLFFILRKTVGKINR